MELLYILNILIGVIGFGLSFAVVNLYTQLKDMKNELSTLHNIYAKKEDVNRDFTTIQASLQRIEDKLDRKQDR